jgi:hypothetical protein
MQTTVCVHACRYCGRAAHLYPTFTHVCMCVHIYIYIYIYTHTHIYAYIHTQRAQHMYVCMHHLGASEAQSASSGSSSAISSSPLYTQTQSYTLQSTIRFPHAYTRTCRPRTLSHSLRFILQYIHKYKYPSELRPSMLTSYSSSSHPWAAAAAARTNASVRARHGAAHVAESDTWYIF